MQHDSHPPILFRSETSDRREAERREERFETLMLRSWTQMRSRTTPFSSDRT